MIDTERKWMDRCFAEEEALIAAAVPALMIEGMADCIGAVNPPAHPAV